MEELRRVIENGDVESFKTIIFSPLVIYDIATIKRIVLFAVERPECYEELCYVISFLPKGQGLLNEIIRRAVEKDNVVTVEIS